MAPTKLPKSKSTKSSSSLSTSGHLLKISQLESSLLTLPYNPNSLAPLIQISKNDDPEVVHKSIWALHRVFIQYITEGKVGGLTTATTGDGERTEGVDEISLGSGGGREVKAWVRDRMLEYVRILGSLLRDREAGLRTSSLSLLFSLLPPLSASISQQEPSLHTVYFRIVLKHLLEPAPSMRGATPRKASGSAAQSDWDTKSDNQVDDDAGFLPADVAAMAVAEFWAKYDDLRWAFFRETSRTPHDSLTIGTLHNLLSLALPLTNLPKLPEDINTFYIPHLSATPAFSTAPTAKKAKLLKKPKKGSAKVDALPEWMASYDSPSSSEDETVPGSKKRVRTSQLSTHASIHSLSSHIAVYTTLWETILSTAELDEYWTRRILVGLHGDKGILGHMKPERRVRVADWLGGLVDRGGVEAVLAMNGLYVLMTRYNFDYPNFYQRLYGLLDADLMHVKYRARFFRLLDVFLASTLLPAALVASFIKRLSLLALTAPPSGIIAIIPFIYNLFKRHPGTMVMIQRLDAASPTEVDPYNAEDPSPLTSKAIDSSCWELKSLQGHYLSTIATLAKIFVEAFTKPEYSLEDFLDHGYGTLFDAEINRKLKYAPALGPALELPEANAANPFPSQSGSGEAGVVDQEGETAQEKDLVSQLWAF